MIEIGQVYHADKAQLEMPFTNKITEIIEGPRYLEGARRNEWQCRCTFTKEYPDTGVKNTYSLNYWVGEDYLLNNINRGRMILNKE